jgi:outer membrane protein OmpA-like peptidoglycan-associated protein
MSFNILDAVKGYLGDDMASQAASFLGENPAAVTKLVSGAVPSLLSGIISKAGTDGGLGVLDLAKQAAGSGILDNVGSLFSGGGNSSLLGTGTSLLSSLFGNKSSLLGNVLASFAGVKPSSSSSILSALAPIALGAIGKHALSNGLSASGLLSLLNGQKDAVAKAMPAGLNLSSVWDQVPGKVKETVSAATGYREAEKPAGLPKWLLPLLLLLLGALALWYFLKGCNNTPATTATTATVDTAKVEIPVVPTVDSASVNAAVTKVKESLQVTLPDGTSLTAFKGGIEDKLVTCLNDANCKAGKDVWYDFDNLNFEMGSAKITAESQTQINNIAAILKAYPKVKIKIGGYTDMTGDDAANLKLSQSRAAATAAAIKAAGGSAAQITGAEGYGSKFAKVAATASDEERQADRHISVSVREK